MRIKPAVVGQVWIVSGYDVGGNSGDVIIAVFDNEEDARYWAEHSPERKWNKAFESSRGSPFWVEKHAVLRGAKPQTTPSRESELET